MKRLPNSIRLTLAFLIAILLVLPAPVYAYAVLSHEAIVDAAWETHIKPLLLKEFPQASEEDLSRAQAYAYGGGTHQKKGFYSFTRPPFCRPPPPPPPLPIILAPLSLVHRRQRRSLHPLA